MPNRLARERSPYLLQHAENPVDWYPWGDEAFARARAEDKPIFLSIGYSTCHWCHVMEHESFESAEIADILNRGFVSIKVDREERPDVDRVYMTFVQATTGSGGWPMSVWLTPDLKPFYGGTYYPPTSLWGRPGFQELLRELGRLWREEREKVVQSADVMVGRLRDAREASPAASRAALESRRITPPEPLGDAVREYEASFDRRRGGFGSAPKFPRPSELLFLMREHARTGNGSAANMALETLRAMALGGMRDHIGGGFHRYSVDAEWRVPHFEKMLYDQAQLVIAYVEAAQIAGDPFHATIAADTLDYVRRDMTDPLGGFYSAEDADSLPPEHAGDPQAHRMEGAFYVWEDEEIRRLLGDDADVARLRWGIEAGGNAPADPQGEFRRKNLLYVARSIEDVARLSGRTPAEVETALGRARQMLFAARAKRPRPHLDDKILSGWNGLMIAAFARAARVLEPGATTEPGVDRSAYLHAARQAAAFLHSTMWDGARQILLRRYRSGDAAIDGYSEDYAFVIWGLLELFQADPDPDWLAWAIRLQRRQDELFWDEAEAGWFSTTGEDASVLLRLKEEYDGAEPAASSVSVLNLLTLAHLTGDAGAAEKVRRTLARLGHEPGRVGRIVPLMLSGVSTYHAGMQQVVIVGGRGAEDTNAMLAEIVRHYLPFAVTIWVTPGDHQRRIASLLPWIEPMTMRDARATAYVCRDFACQAPISDVDELGRVVGAADVAPSPVPHDFS
ncbi:MAG: thioredoxin domain-containing protein [Acidobacteria bacterium]|nr:thioredoxin domain-containing protein [Acidobacteriota bacterium]